jgi:hypothetical protein
MKNMIIFERIPIRMENTVDSGDKNNLKNDAISGFPSIRWVITRTMVKKNITKTVNNGNVRKMLRSPRYVIMTRSAIAAIKKNTNWETIDRISLGKKSISMSGITSNRRMASAGGSASLRKPFRYFLIYSNIPHERIATQSAGIRYIRRNCMFSSIILRNSPFQF